MLDELPFTSKIISGNRVTIPKDVIEILGLTEGDRIIVKVKPLKIDKVTKTRESTIGDDNK